jgi:hypothetical protein
MHDSEIEDLMLQAKVLKHPDYISFVVDSIRTAEESIHKKIRVRVDEHTSLLGTILTAEPIYVACYNGKARMHYRITMRRPSGIEYPYPLIVSNLPGLWTSPVIKLIETLK